MIITGKLKGEQFDITIPDDDYWIGRSKKRVASYWENTDKLENAITNKYAKTYKELEKELYTFAGKYGKNGELPYSKQRVIQLMKLLNPHIAEASNYQENKLTAHLINTYSNNYYSGLHELASGTKLYSSFVALDENAVKTAVTFPWSGENFSDRIYANKQKLVRTLKSEITNSLIRGDSLPQTARAISQRVKVSLSDATRLVQTETAAVITSSNKKMYEDFDVEEYRYVATLDNRTSATCQDLDGRTFKVKEMMSGLNAPPMHPRCRSNTVPDFGDNTGKRIARNIQTGQTEYVPASITYKMWYNKYVE